MEIIKKLKNLFNKPEKRDPLKSQASRELGKLKEKKLDKDSLGNLNKIFRIFLKEKYKLKRSLTYEELIKKIEDKRINKKVKVKIIGISSKINRNMYDPDNSEFKGEDFNTLISEIMEIIKKA